MARGSIRVRAVFARSVHGAARVSPALRERAGSVVLAALFLNAWQAGAAQEAGIDPAGPGAETLDHGAPGTSDMTSQPTTDQIRARVDAAQAERAQPIVLAAATMPGRREPDPPTGPLAAAPAARAGEQLQSGPGSRLPAADSNGTLNGLNGNGRGGIRWRFAPVLWAGNVSVDGRWSRDGDGVRSQQLLLNTNLDGASYLWQPWFAQVRGGVGALFARGSSNDLFGAARSDSVVAWTGRLGVSVFPASRFPFEARGDVSDSRAGGDYLGTDYRSKRLSVSQSYRPPTGSDTYNVTYDYSALSSSRLPDDTVSTLRGLMVNVAGNQSFELSGSHSLNERGGSQDQARVTSVTGRHGYRGGAALTVDNLATYNDFRVRSEAAALDYVTSIKQLSSFTSWRPQRGDPLYSPERPLYLTGSVRMVESDTESAGASAQARALNATVGASADLTRRLRLATGVSASTIEQSNSEDLTLTSEAVTLAYTPDAIALGEWRYTPQIAGSGNFTQGGPEGNRNVLGAQVGHGVSRGYALGGDHDVSVTLAQSAGVTRDSTLEGMSRTLGHSASLFWRIAGDTQSQTFAGLSASDSRSYGASEGAFQLVNLQVTRRSQLSRTSSWSGSVTAQATRSRFTTVADAFTTPLDETGSDTGWQHFYSASLSYTEVRAFGVPRLRFSLLATANSEQTERRADGDADASREHVSHSVEARFDHAIGRLDSRLTLRTARIDGRRQDVIFFRVNRSFGGY